MVHDNGVYFHKGDVEDLRKELDYLLTHAGVTELFRTRASDFVCSHYQWDRIVNETLHLYGAND